ncbi:ead/Ea22-like family protein [Klebsiella aerogenes]|uniref:ead/Ea22-like family protein n=1 Tax=Klebsiella aerogenes TaxID=548 RepID=UPI002FF8A059
MSNITGLAQSLKAAAEKATPGQWMRSSVQFNSITDIANPMEQGNKPHIANTSEKRDAEFIALANPANILALVEALEKAQAAERRWHQMASRIHEQACESDVKIDEFEAIRAAAEKLVRCKGRYHSEQNYRALAALFGVTTPDLPPLDGEPRTVTVKQGEVLVTVAGFTGCGKSAIAGEIEIAMKAIGVPVTWANGEAEKRMTGADWLTAIEMYKPTVRIVEENIPSAAGIQAEPVTTTNKLVNSSVQGESRCGTKCAPALDSSSKNAKSRGGNSPVNAAAGLKVV